MTEGAGARRLRTELCCDPLSGSSRKAYHLCALCRRGFGAVRGAAMARLLRSEHGLDVRFRTISDLREDIDQSLAERRERIFDARRNLGVDGTHDYAVALERPQRLRQHLLRDTRYLPLQL